MPSSAAAPLLGSTTPRLWTPPLVTGPPGPCGCGCPLTPETSLGFDFDEFVRDPIGALLLPYQRWLAIHALELLPNGRFRFRTILVLIARQNGKTAWIEFKSLWKMFVLQVPLIINTAQALEYAEESWAKGVELVEGTPELNAEVKQVDYTNGKKALRLVNGSRWKIATSSRRGGRSLSADDVNVDELREHLNWQAWAAVSKTTTARANAQVCAFSNAGDDRSVVLNSLQATGRAAAEHPEVADPSVGHFEWSVPDDVDCDCDRHDGPHATTCMLMDRQLWAMANPAYGYTITDDALRGFATTDPTPVFLTESLCKRVPQLVPPVLSPAVWASRGGLDRAVRPTRPLAFAIGASWPDAEHGSIGVAGLLGAQTAVQLVVRRPGTSWMVARAVEVAKKWRALGVALDPKGPAGFLLPELKVACRKARVKLILPKMGEVVHAYGLFHAGVKGDPKTGAGATVRHYDQDDVAAAVAEAQRRPLGDAWTWARKGQADIAPIEVLTLAAWAVWTQQRPKASPPRAAGAPGETGSEMADLARTGF